VSENGELYSEDVTVFYMLGSETKGVFRGATLSNLVGEHNLEGPKEGNITANWPEDISTDGGDITKREKNSGGLHFWGTHARVLNERGTRTRLQGPQDRRLYKNTWDI